MSDPKVSIFTGRKTRYLAEKIAESYGAELGKSIVTNFSDGELQTSYEENIRGKMCLLFSQHFHLATIYLNCL